MVVLDTCAIIELFKENPTFSKKSIKIMEEKIFVLSVSFSEIFCKVKLKKLELNMTPQNVFKMLLEVKSVEVIDVGIEEWAGSIELDWSLNKDPADRLITAFAMKHDFFLVTSDQKIKDFYHKVIW